MQVELLEVNDPDFEFLHGELNVERLNKVHNLLWLAGRPMPPRPLHYQRASGREIVITEQMSLHLLWGHGKMYLKPIPRYLLDYAFWRDKIQCSQRQLYGCALGFLLSYVALIQYESDFHIAQEHRLVPPNLSFARWRAFVKSLLADRSSTYVDVNERYLFGELRLNRLNLIYRFALGSWRGYVYPYQQYSQFFIDNLTPILSFIGYVAIVLTAMQVGLATDRLAGNIHFQRVCYGFTVFSILGPPALVGFVFCRFRHFDRARGRNGPSP
ncbi:hypothetical protein BDY21DRAFT_414808 [Lineolata rhizophorae]|uniref:Uncharacterized protein n=1 Tax=Lineolata rhizophorae TaxID=578093 RepID=A0A6A6P1H3_9PEZI|nr:hypothetical protein BDY21DRAFT_414808 [Lineolata rhizophorae]